MYKFIFVGPLPSPITGQSIAFKYLCDNFEQNKLIFDYSSDNQSIVGLLWLNLKFVISYIANMVFYRKTLTTLYLTTSRSLFGFFRDAIIILFASLLGVRVINHLHGADFLNFRCRYKWLKPIIDYVYSLIDTSIVLTLRMKEQYSIYEKMNIFVVPNFYDFGNVSFSVSNKINGPLKVAYLSNLMPTKGIFHLVSAVKELNAEGYEVTLNIAGSIMGDTTATKSEVTKMVDSQINDVSCINYVGTVNGKNKLDFLLNSNVFCLPSFYLTEGQPISIIEAMACGLYIITTKHNYLDELVSKNEGSLIDIQSIKQIKSSLLFLIQNPKVLEETAIHNQRHAKSEFSLETYINSLTEIIMRN
ncbi:glycosyltransferase family 4 protein [Vibrio mediterranei]|uniref:glycosyltransferase family 4 protein n=1 Tax=Vibrio mediterranei TaxID=689 RepID=UPI001EFCDAA9|nr:glycosyltransferase family 4 protein [Vibrio mediterranei]MCG9666042.1 glycosyltransferase family 4 protein [Vibrio mediterranei]